jgi:Rod binding domain-containing protein
MQVPLATPLTASVPIPSTSTANDPKALRRHAVEFEAILLGQVLEKLEQTCSSVPGEQPSDAGHDTESSLATQALASGIAKAGGFGFARMVLKYLPQPEAAAGQSETTPTR